MNPAEIAVLLGLNLTATLAVMLGLGIWAVRSNRIGVVDGAWPLLLAGLAAVTFVAAEGDPVRKGLLLWLVALWALPQALRRLSSAPRHAADARYAAVAAAFAARRGWRPALVPPMLFFLPQGALAWLTALPVQLGQVDFQPPVGWVGWSGAVLAVLGIGLEGLGSLKPSPRRVAQAAAAASIPGTRRWLLRPDYLGDLAVWWGLFLIAAETAPGQASIIGPIFLTGLMAHWLRTGATDTENPRRERDGG